MECIFCKIIKGEIPSYTIFEDDKIKVFLDIHPSTNGDLLIIPKKHCVTMMDIDSETILHIHEISKKLYLLLKEKLHCEGVTIVQNNDYGQEVKHYHVHLTPRYTKDGLKHQYHHDQLKALEEIHTILTNKN